MGCGSCFAEAVDLNLTDPQIFSISFNENPKVGDEVSISYGGNIKTIIFTDAQRTKRNQTFCQVGDSLGIPYMVFLKPSNQHLSVSMLTKVNRYDFDYSKSSDFA